MEKIRLYALFLIGIMMFGCSKYDDTELKNDVNDLKSRVEKLETWCNTTNGQISALQGIVSALESKDFIAGVTPIMEGSKEVGYTITFTKGKPITIMNGKDGAKGDDGDQGIAGKDGVTPIIGVKQDTDGHYYWTVQVGDASVQWMKDASGNNIRTTGDKGDKGDQGDPGTDGEDGHSPVLSVAEFEGRLYWQLDSEWLISGEKKVPATGDKGETGATGLQGDAIFAKDGIDYTSDPENVIFTLADGTTTIKLPKSSTISIGFDSYDTFYCSETENEVAIVLPLTLKKSDYNAIVATISNQNGTDMDIQTRSASLNTWGVEVIKPTFTDGTLVAGSAKVIVTLPQDKTNYNALLKVTLIDSKGKEHSASRVVWFKADKDVNVIDNTTGALSSKIVDAANVKQLSIIGPVSDDDFAYIGKSMKSLQLLDLSRSSITSLPEQAVGYYVNTTLKTIILPEGLTSIGNYAFSQCKALSEINLPRTVRTLGVGVFSECNSLEEVKLFYGITEIGKNAFYDSYIKRITLPSSVKTIGNGAFVECHNLVSVTIPNSVTTIGSGAFNKCPNLTSITIPSSVTSLGESVLRECVNLESVEILANVTTLQNNFFMNSPKLNSVKLSTSITTLGSNAFCDTGLTEYTIPSHITTMKAGAFTSNKKLHTVTLPAVAADLEWSTFQGCISLKNVTIPEGFKVLGADMFRNCGALESIVLPSTITAIRDRAFQGCSNLKSITCKAATIPALIEYWQGLNENFHFSGINASCVLKRPAGSDYSAWSSVFKGGIQDL